ncbi:MAG TPA: hypothetical protein GX513_15455 [Firmicutes bacterium]|nr:hypothetical protein [Bacillota bacterium]
MAKDNNHAHNIDLLRQSLGPIPSPGSAQTPVGYLAQAATTIQNTLRQEQFTSEQELQSTLTQSSTKVSQAQRLEQMLNLANQLVQTAQGGADMVRQNLPQFQQTLQELKTQVAEEETQIGTQVAQSLQQAISSLSQAQAAMVQAQSFRDLNRLVGEAEHLLGQIQKPADVVT